MVGANTPHPSGLNRQQRRNYAKAAGMDLNGSRHVAALQQTRKFWCEEGSADGRCPGGVYHTEHYCASCSARNERPTYELRGEEAEWHRSEWEQ